ncbi:MAG: cysteine synthase CysM [Piscirickettsiaceae bacterium]|nr:cysteine synthase CysM [Piscirickettsiaceae bacterium]
MKLYSTIETCIGNTPLVRLQRLPEQTSNKILVKLEGLNPSGSVKDRPVLSMIQHAQARGDIKPYDILIEATSGNTGISLAMVASIFGYEMILIMPENVSIERRISIRAYGAKIILTKGMEEARDLALQMEHQGKGKVLNQFSNLDNPLSHYETTGPEIWLDTGGQVTHFVSAMGTTGTIMGTSRYLKEQNIGIQIVGVQPADGSNIPGIRRWPKKYLPTIFEPKRIDLTIDIEEKVAVNIMRKLATEEGIFCGISSGGAVAAALRLSKQVNNAVIVSIICDRGERYLSTDVFSPI